MEAGYPNGNRIAVAADLLLLYCVGAFSVSSTMQDVGLGVYSANLNVFWNPLGKGQILHTDPFREGQDEGFGYLGALVYCCFFYVRWCWLRCINFLNTAIENKKRGCLKIP